MTNPRDIYLQQFKPALDDKEDRHPPFRAVVTSATGSTTTGDVWKNENARLVWFRAWGSGSPAWALCDVLEPVLGLGVFIKFNIDINQYEVLRDDPLMRSPDSDRTSYRAITNQDLLKGGRFQLWLEPTMIIPLSIYPTGDDTVNIVEGDYIFQGERKTFAGAVDQDISASRPAAGNHRLVGFYLDSSNALQTVDGAAVATGTDAADPIWPANTFRLGVVDIDNATAISIDDINNRKVVWTEDDNTGILNVWPRADEVNIDYTAYASWPLAVDALAASDQAIIGEGSFESDSERIDTASFVKGSGVDVSILETTTKDRVLTLAKAFIILEDFTLNNTCSHTLYGDYYGAYIDEDSSIDAFRVKFEVICTGANINYGVYIASAGTHRFAECIWNVQNGTANYALYIDAQGLYSGAVVELFDPDITGDVYNIDGTLNIYGGKIDGDICDSGGCTINLYNLPLITGSVTGGTINGAYIDSNGDIHTLGWPPPGQVYRWDVSAGVSILEADLPTAVSNLDDGDAIVLGLGSYALTSQLSITKNCTILGPQSDDINIGTTPVSITGDVTGGLISVSGNPDVSFVNLYIENSTTTGAGHGIIVDDANVYLTNCYIYAESSDDVADGVYADSTNGSTRIYVFGGRLECNPATNGYAVNLAVHSSTLLAQIYHPAHLIGDTADINAVASADVYLYKPTLDANSINGAGTFYGEFLSTNGVTYYVGDTTPADDQFPKWDNANSRWVPGYVDELWESDAGNLAWAVDTVGNLEDQLGRTTVTTWYDYPIFDTANDAGIASHFRDNDNSYPAGWTEADAAAATDTDDLYSFWFLRGSSGETSWKYRIKSSLDLEVDGASYNSFLFGPIFFRDAAFSADLHYRFGLYRDNAGAIDENTYIRVDLYWNSGSSVWQVRGEESDGSTPHTSSYVSLPTIPIQPIWLRCLVRNTAAKTTRAYVGYINQPRSHTRLLSQNPTVAPTWGDVWIQFEMSRGAGLDDYLFIGGVDYPGNEA